MLGSEAIQTTSLADMMFLLLIFFIITTTLQKMTGFVADIPAGTKDESQQKEKITSVALHDGQISLNDQKVSMRELRAKIKSLRLDQKIGENKIVLLNATGKVPYQDYFEAMAIIQNSGGIVVIVREEDKGKQ
jgi:biopolymer transport protein ExbD